VKALLDPFVTILYSVPRFALVPLMLVWLGIGIWSKVAVVFLGAVFAIIITVSEGVRNLDGEIVQCAESFGASRNQILRTVALPASVPYILAGLRLAIARGLVGVVVGELVASEHGLGQEMAVAGQTFQTPTVFAIVGIFAFAGVFFNLAVGVVERRFESWRITGS
jgi:ABC-type nitrate/sulfonate/bicarbonate transport system permease component